MKKIFTMILSAFMLLPTVLFGGCQLFPESEKGYYVLNDFESADEFDLLRLFGVLGKVEKNTNAEYVTNGNASAKIILDSTPYKQRSPYMEQAFELVKKGEDHRDFTNVSAISFDVYNTSETAVSMGVQLTYDESNGMKQKYTLSKGWTTVSFTVKREYIPRTANEEGQMIPWAENMRISFDRTAQDTVLYMDNVRLYKAGKPQATVRRSLDENEICSFDQEWQIAMLTPSAEKLELLPSFMASYDNTATGEGASLRIETSESNFAGGSYPGVELKEDVVGTVDWTKYPEDATLCFDVYSPEENGVDIVWLSAYTDTMRYYVSDEIHVTPGKWQTFSVTVKEMNLQLNHKDYNFGKTTSLVFRWMEHANPSRVVYFDNVRIELAE